jgi:sulfopyruvate decarboxylase TPP-binding subunit
MGKYMQDFLKTMKIPTIILSKNDLPKQIPEADQMMEKSETPVALVLKKGIVE